MTDERQRPSAAIVASCASEPSLAEPLVKEEAGNYNSGPPCSGEVNPDAAWRIEDYQRALQSMREGLSFLTAENERLRSEAAQPNVTGPDPCKHKVTPDNWCHQCPQLSLAEVRPCEASGHWSNGSVSIHHDIDCETHRAWVLGHPVPVPRTSDAAYNRGWNDGSTMALAERLALAEENAKLRSASATMTVEQMRNLVKDSPEWVCPACAWPHEHGPSNAQVARCEHFGAMLLPERWFCTICEPVIIGSPDSAPKASKTPVTWHTEEVPYGFRAFSRGGSPGTRTTGPIRDTLDEATRDRQAFESPLRRNEASMTCEVCTQVRAGRLTGCIIHNVWWSRQ